MATTYTEKRDSQGRVSIELKTHQPTLLVAGVVGVPLIAWARDLPRKQTLIFGAIAFAVMLLVYFYRRKPVRLLINPAAHTLAVGAGTDTRVVKMEQVERARIDEREVYQDKRKVMLYRIELMLRSSEIVSLTPDHGNFELED